MKIGLALSSGGARGLAHIGVLRALEKLRINVDFIAGSSMGAIVGGLYSLNPNAEEVREKVEFFLKKYEGQLSSFKNYCAESEEKERRLFLEKSFRFIKKLALWNLKIIKPYLMNPKLFFQIIRDIFKEYTFEQCKIPFVCSAVDLIAGEPFFMLTGRIYKAVAASALLPGFFPPIQRKGKLLVDGGVLVPLPASILKDKVDFIIGVTLEEEYLTLTNVKNVLDVIFLIDRIRYKEILRSNLKDTDFIIRPPVHSYKWVDFDKYEELIPLGEKETFDHQKELMRRIKRAKWRKFFLPFNRRRENSGFLFCK